MVIGKAICVILSLFTISNMVLAEVNPVVLTVSGKIGKFTDKGRKVYEFRDDDLKALKQHSIATKTSWTPRSNFSGPLMRDILDSVSASGTLVKFMALNDYAYSIERSEFSKYDVILARFVNNKILEVKDRGPLWLMYPIFDMPDEARGPLLDAKLIWQVNRIVVY
ncbi:hypothetical protein ACEU07_04195 [Chromobacterium violaceum]|uniref:hypothetical protein n=1 Tax=Chromobacterium violaceum TaxID=536 RepID=UPI0035A68192